MHCNEEFHISMTSPNSSNVNLVQNELNVVEIQPPDDVIEERGRAEPETPPPVTRQSHRRVESSTNANNEDYKTTDSSSRLPRKALDSLLRAFRQDLKSRDMRLQSRKSSGKQPDDKDKEGGHGCRCSSLPHNGRLLSIFYGVHLALLGTVFPVREVLNHEWLTDLVVAVFLVYLYGFALIAIIGTEIYLVVMSRRHGHNAADDKRARHTGTRNSTFTEDDLKPERDFEQGDWRRSTSSYGDSEYPYSFSESGSEGDRATRGAHSTSMYLRAVLIVLGLASMVYDGLLVRQLQSGQSPSSCGHDTLFWTNGVHIGFLLAQTYFLFKHETVTLRTCEAVFRGVFAHILATNWTVFFRTFLRHTVDAYYLRQYKHNGLTNIEVVRGNGSSVKMADCDFLNDTLFKAAPYLYPCVLEYNILAAILTVILLSSWQPLHQFYHQDSTEEAPKNTATNTATPIRRGGTEISFHRTHKGLFMGIMVLAGTCVSIILFFSYFEHNDKSENSLLIFRISSLSLHGVVFIAVAIAWFKIRQMGLRSDRSIAKEHVALLLLMSAGILLELFRVIPATNEVIDGRRDLSGILSLADSLLSIGTIIFQTGFVIDLSFRYLLTEEHFYWKPGRGSVTFLLISNIALWLLQTFRLKQVELEMETFASSYGYVAWYLIVNLLVPCLIFYYIFVSSRLAVVWHEAYTDTYHVTTLQRNRIKGHVSAVTSTPASASQVRQRRPPSNNEIHLVDLVMPISDV